MYRDSSFFETTCYCGAESLSAQAQTRLDVDTLLTTVSQLAKAVGELKSLIDVPRPATSPGRVPLLQAAAAGHFDAPGSLPSGLHGAHGSPGPIPHDLPAAHGLPGPQAPQVEEADDLQEAL